MITYEIEIPEEVVICNKVMVFNRVITCDNVEELYQTIIDLESDLVKLITCEIYEKKEWTELKKEIDQLIKDGLFNGDNIRKYSGSIVGRFRKMCCDAEHNRIMDEYKSYLGKIIKKHATSYEGDGFFINRALVVKEYREYEVTIKRSLKFDVVGEKNMEMTVSIGNNITIKDNYVSYKKMNLMKQLPRLELFLENKNNKLYIYSYDGIFIERDGYKLKIIFDYKSRGIEIIISDKEEYETFLHGLKTMRDIMLKLE